MIWEPEDDDEEYDDLDGDGVPDDEEDSDD